MDQQRKAQIRRRAHRTAAALIERHLSGLQTAEYEDDAEQEFFHTACLQIRDRHWKAASRG